MTVMHMYRQSFGRRGRPRLPVIPISRPQQVRSVSHERDPALDIPGVAGGWVSLAFDLGLPIALLLIAVVLIGLRFVVVDPAPASSPDCPALRALPNLPTPG